ncbi:aminotransferase [Campylobacter sp. RM15925]|uniref:aminotransferase n=1 Tax=Campylobacter sp. RM15925 TaxID=1705724 RepID=UPI001473F0B3|nr:aminotransferase [Campylobacter sp. RM15925]
MQNENFDEILVTACALESRGVKLYENLQKQDDVFAQILAVRKSGLTLLEQSYGSVSYKEQECFFAPSNDIQSSLIKALNYEIELNAAYENLTQNCDDEGLRDILFRLWATSHNEYIPALKARLCTELNAQNNGYASNFNKQEYKEYKKDDCDDDKDEYKKYEYGDKFGFGGFNENSFKEMSKILEKVASGRGSQEDIAALLNSPHISFFGGLALGGLAGVFLNNMIKQEGKEDDKQNQQ